MSSTAQAGHSDIDQKIVDLLRSHSYTNRGQGLMVPRDLYEFLTGETIFTQQGLLTVEQVISVMFEKLKTCFNVVWGEWSRRGQISDTQLWIRMCQDAQTHQQECGTPLRLMVYVEVDMRWVGIGCLAKNANGEYSQVKLWTVHQDGLDETITLEKNFDQHVVDRLPELRLL